MHARESRPSAFGWRASVPRGQLNKMRYRSSYDSESLWFMATAYSLNRGIKQLRLPILNARAAEETIARKTGEETGIWIDFSCRRDTE